MNAIKAPLTPDGAEMTMLTAANKNTEGLYIVPFGAMPVAMMQQAFERLVLADHLRLVDVNIVPISPTQSGPGRIFKMTPEGRKRLAMLMVSAK